MAGRARVSGTYPGFAALARDSLAATTGDQVGAKPRVAFFSLFSARFSFIVFAGFFFVSFLRSMPLLMVFPLSGGHGTVLRPGAKYAPAATRLALRRHAL